MHWRVQVLLKRIYRSRLRMHLGQYQLKITQNANAKTRAKSLTVPVVVSFPTVGIATIAHFRLTDVRSSSMVA